MGIIYGIRITLLSNRNSKSKFVFTDVYNTVQSLPRPPNESALVPVKLKKALRFSSHYFNSTMRPNICRKAVIKLKESGNKHYKDIEVSEELPEKNEVENQEEDESSDEELEPSEGPDEDRGQTLRDHATCLTSLDPELDEVVNRRRKEKNLKEQTFEIAPGEDKKPTDILQTPHVDEMAYPDFHLTGKFGIDHPREKKLSKQQYFGQRLLNEDDRFSNDASYVFTSQHMIEKDSIRSQIAYAGQKGPAENIGNGTKKITMKDPVSVFQKVPGTPKYWQLVKNEMIAKVKQLGPFHLFFTFSCAETKWFDVMVSALRKKYGDSITIEFENDDRWDGNEDKIFVIDGKERIKLWDWINSKEESKHKLLKDSMFLVTSFNERVKSYIKNLLMAHKHNNSDDPTDVPIEYYNYRVEFQGGHFYQLPHKNSN